MANYPISGKVYGIGKSSVQASVNINCYDITQSAFLKTEARVQTNSSGEYTIDLEDLLGTFANGDHIVLIATYGSYVGFLRHTVNTGVGSYPNAHMYLHTGPSFLGECFLKSVMVANDIATVQSVKLYDLETDEMITKIVVPADSSEVWHAGGIGLRFMKGIIVEYSTESGDIEATLEIKGSGQR